MVILEENGFAPGLLSTICELKGRKTKICAGLPEVEDGRKRLTGLKS